MERVLQFDESLFWWINQHHSPALDWTMWFLSNKISWILVLLSVYLIVTIIHDRKSWFWVLTGIALCFLLADQVSNNVIKDGVMRLRPCHALENVRMFHTNKGGLYGFVSSHAANSFAIAMFLSLMYGGKKKKIVDNKKSDTWLRCMGSGYKALWIPYFMFVWAAVVGYSRPYLGKHYLGDVVCGAILGIGIGAAVYFVILKIRAFIVSKSSE